MLKRNLFATIFASLVFTSPAYALSKSADSAPACEREFADVDDAQEYLEYCQRLPWNERGHDNRNCSWETAWLHIFLGILEDCLLEYIQDDENPILTVESLMDSIDQKKFVPIEELKK